MCAGTNKSVTVFDMNVGRNVRIMADVHTRPAHVICQNEVSLNKYCFYFYVLMPIDLLLTYYRRGHCVFESVCPLAHHKSSLSFHSW